MIKNYNDLSDLYKETVSAITSTPQSWKKFLSCSANNYKLRFDEQLLVFAQRPDSTAVLEMENWNKYFGRWVNRRATSIAVFANKDLKNKRINFYFDISDTHESKNAKPVPIWSMREEYTGEVVDILDNNFGLLDNKSTLEEAIFSASRNACEDNIPDYVGDLITTVDNSFLEDLTEDAITVMYRQLVTNSVAYMIMSRLGLDADKYFEQDDFRDIVYFNTVDSINALGFATSDIAEMELIEIAKAIQTLDKAKNLTENKNEINIDRSNENEHHLHRDRWISVSGLDSGGESRTEIGTVRSDEERLSAESSQGDLLQLLDQRNFGRTSSGNGTQSTRDDGQSNRENESSTRSDGRTQEERPDGLGSGNEQHHQRSKRNSEYRSDLRLETYEKDGSKNRPFVVIDEAVNSILSTTPHLKVSHKDIIDFFNEETDESKRATFLKESFNYDFTSVDINEKTYGYKAYSNGLLLWRGYYPTRDAETFLSWENLSHHFDSMILLNQIRIDNKTNNKPKLEFTSRFIDKYLQTRAQVRKFAIYEQFQKSLSNKDNANFLKDLYGISGGTHTISGAGVGYDCNSKGTKFYCGYDKDKVEKVFSWNELSKQIKRLIEEDKYLTEKEKLEYPIWLDEQEQRRAEFAKQRENLKILSVAPETLETPRVEYEYKYKLGDTVYLGTDEYQIISLDDNRVLLYDTKYPLFNKELPVEEFDTKIKENPLNDHLKVIKSDDNELIGKELVIDGHRFVIERIGKVSNDVSMRDITLAESGVPINRVEKLDMVKKLLKEQKTTETATNEQPKIKDSISFSIGFSEHPAFYDKDLNDRYTNISFALGNKLLGVLDEKQHRERATKENVGWYHKTDFEISGVIDGEDFKYNGRFDIGDGEGNLIAHIKNHITYCLSPDSAYHSLWKNKGEEYYQEQVNSYNESLNTLIPFLEQNSELSQEDNKLFDEIMSLENEWFPDYDAVESTQEEVVEDTKNQTIYEQFSEQWNKYSQIKEKHENSMVLYQVGDFFEVMGKDAERFAELSGVELLSKRVSKEYTVAMCGIPSHKLEDYVEILRNNGHSIVFATIENDELVLRGMEAKEKATPDKENIEKDSITAPAFAIPRAMHSTSFDLHPDIPLSDRHNFKLSDNEVELVSKKERFRRNVRALNILKECEFENRLVTPEEQIALSKYVGWGGIPEAFDENNTSWSNEFKELCVTLSPDEYASARESTLTAFYTPLEVISSMYKALENLGFKSGNILEPSCGTGNFIGMLPDSMNKSKFHGVELDPVSAKIAQQLYQKTSIASQGFEETNLPDNFFDIVIGNVPFGDFKVLDKRYDKHNFLIHDYFFAKSLDKLRPGGVMALITSSGTMDKKNSNVRRYLSQRADLLGAIRLPNNTFSGNAGTEVVSDILFLQKKERMIDYDADWLHTIADENGNQINEYFVNHPEMVLGELKTVSGRYGRPQLTCVPKVGTTLKEELSNAIVNITGTYKDAVVQSEVATQHSDETLPADPSVRNFSYTLVNDKIYFRENSIMTPEELSVTTTKRIKGMIEIRDSARRLIELQSENYPDSEIVQEQKHLNECYNRFIRTFGFLNSRGNKLAFQKDSSYPLLSSLEILDENGKFVEKADMFTKRTITPHIPVTSVDTSSEALALALSEKAFVDMEYMTELTGKTEQEIFEDLKGVVFLNPLYESGTYHQNKYLTADEYLSGNVREKLAWAERSAKLYPEDYAINVEALKRVQPKDLSASEISVRLGSTWVPTEDIRDFIIELLTPNRYSQYEIKVHFSEHTGEWRVDGKSSDTSNVKANTTYGTSRANAYKIIENTLNLTDVKVFDYIEKPDGNTKAVLNKKETALAQAKQEQIKQAFAEWIWKEPKRRDRLTKSYNEKFNSLRPREFDGSHLSFVGMNPEINLRPHQKNAVAHIIYGGNTLLAHAVGAGKSFEMIAAAKELKRLGLCNKPMFAVPNHLTEQWASEFLRLYPASNILVATKKDFERKNRQRFCGRIATGDYDAIIIGHSQFEKIPMSVEYQRHSLESQIDDILEEIARIKRQNGSHFTVKQLEKSKKALSNRLHKLNDQSRKDDLVTFEELGVDHLFVDESHYYKNLYLYTKMRNVGGIAQTEAQKASDLFMKCQYLDSITDGKGVVFATGTPISNSMVELYTIQRYLQYNTLQQHNLQNFDSWASTFGETVSAIELTPEGKGYRSKTRFAKFHNLPELMSMFKEVADIQTADMLKLPVPKANYINVSVKPSEFQKELVNSLAERAEKIRNGSVDASQDNMLKITNDGRNLALDQRLINDTLPDFEGSKTNACVDNVYRIWSDTKDKKSTQLVFCDLSTPKDDGSFSVYNDIKKKLIERGIPEKEIEFIHNAKTDVQKLQLFQRTRSGEVRVLMGSTQKMGAGTNVQDKLIALHDLDCPWRPSDLEQRSGRIIRQGNTNNEVFIYRYVTEETFDAYLYQLVEGKQKFASQIMTSKSPARSAEDVDATALSYAEIKMLATGNPYIKEKMDLDIQVQKLKLLKSDHLTVKYSLEDKIIKYYPQRIAYLSSKVEGLKDDLKVVNANPRADKDNSIKMEVNGTVYTERASAGQALIGACSGLKSSEPVPVGTYRGFSLELSFDLFMRKYYVNVTGKTRTRVELSVDNVGNIIRIDNAIDKCFERLTFTENELEETTAQFENAKLEVMKPFPQEEELNSKLERLSELNALLNVDEKVIEVAESGVETENVIEHDKNKERNEAR